MVSRRLAWRGTVGSGKERQAGMGKEWCVEAGTGSARYGRKGKAVRGTASLGRQGMAWRGKEEQKQGG